MIVNKNNNIIMEKGKNIKKQIFYFAFLVLFILVFLNSVSKASIIEPNSDFFVNDNAGILSNDTKKYIMNMSFMLQNPKGLILQSII